MRNIVKKKSLIKRIFAFLMALLLVLCDDLCGIGTIDVFADSTVSITLGNPTYTQSGANVYIKYENLEVTASGLTVAVVQVENGTIESRPSGYNYTVLSDLSNTTNTIIFSTGAPVSASAVQTYLRQMTFKANHADKPVYISITVDANNTSLPAGAELSAGDGVEYGLSDHFYMYVANDGIKWRDAYNAAKTYYFMGHKGYLVTITDAKEDKILGHIFEDAAWSGGTRLTGNTYDGDTWSSTSTDNNFRWMCGPEKGSIYYKSATASDSAVINGVYINWNSGEPNNSSTEPCMQVHAGTAKKWNDLNVDSSSVKGYFVEFGGYASEATVDASKTATATQYAGNVTIKFDANAGTDTVTGMPASVTKKNGNTYDVTATPKRAGYYFNGWYTAASNGTEIESNSVVTIAGFSDITLYAGWTAITGEMYESELLTFGGSDANIVEESITVNVKVNDTSSNVASVELYNGSDLAFTLSAVSTGVYKVSRSYVSNGGETSDTTVYKVYVNGKDTGKTATFGDANATLVSYTKSEVRFKKNGVIDENLADGVSLVKSGSDTLLMQKMGSATTTVYEIELLDSLASGEYSIYADGKDTGVKVTLGQNATVEYASVDVKVYQDGVAYDVDSVKLAVNGAQASSAVECEKVSAGVYGITLPLKDCNTNDYAVYVNGEDTGALVSFTDASKRAASVNYYKGVVNIHLDGVNNGSKAQKVELSTSKTTNTHAYALEKEYDNGNPTGVYSFVKLQDATSYYVWVDDEYVNATILFDATNSNRNQTVDYYTVSYNINVNSLTGITGTTPESVVLQKNSKYSLADKSNLKGADYVFSGWKISDKTYIAGEKITITGTTSVQAVWKEKSACPVKWTTPDGEEKYGTPEEAVDDAEKYDGPVEIIIQSDPVIFSGTPSSDPNEPNTFVIPENAVIKVPSPKQVQIKEGTDVLNKGDVIIENGATFEDGGGIFENEGTISNDGTFVNKGTLKNKGDIDNDGTIEGPGIIDNDGGTIANEDGTVTVVIDNDGGTFTGGTVGSGGSVNGGTVGGDVIITGGTVSPDSTDGAIIKVNGGQLTYDTNGKESNLNAVFEGTATRNPTTGVIKLNSDIEISETIVIKGHTTIDLNGHAIHTKPGMDAIIVDDGGKLVIKDSKGGGKINGGDGDAGDESNPSKPAGNGITVKGNGGLNVEGDITITGGSGTMGDDGGNGGTGVEATGSGPITLGTGVTVIGGNGGPSTSETGTAGTGGPGFKTTGTGKTVLKGNVVGGAGGAAKGTDENGQIAGTGGNGGSGVDAGNGADITISGTIQGGAGSPGKNGGSGGTSVDADDDETIVFKRGAKAVSGDAGTAVYSDLYGGKTGADGSAGAEAGEIPTITSQPKSVSIKEGETAKFAVSCSDDGTYWYQWYVSVGKVWKPLENETSKYLTIYTKDTSLNGSKYRCGVSSAFGETYSDEVTLTVSVSEREVDNTPVITGKPKSTKIVVGESASFTVEVDETNGPCTYQWYINRNDGKGWVLITRSTTATHKTDIVSEDCNGFRYKCVITREGKSVETDEVILTVDARENKVDYTPVITGKPKNTKIAVGESASFTVDVDESNGPCTYQWYINRNDGNGWVLITRSTTATHKTNIVSEDCNGFRYKCVITREGKSVETDEVTLTVNVRENEVDYTPVITGKPKSTKVTVGESTSFMVEVDESNGPCTYQWYINRNDGNGWVIITQSTTATHKTDIVSEACNGFRYKCVITREGKSIETDEVMLTVIAGQAEEEKNETGNSEKENSETGNEAENTKQGALSDKMQDLLTELDRESGITMKEIEAINKKSEIGDKGIAPIFYSDEQIEQLEKTVPVVNEEAIATTAISGDTLLKVGLGNVLVIVDVVDDNHNREGEVITGFIATNAENLLKACLTEEERVLVEAGEQAVVRLLVTNEVMVAPKDDTKQIEKAIEKHSENINGLKLGKYVDITLQKSVGGADWQRIKELNEELEVSFDVPQELIAEGRTYFVMRNHEGVCELLNDLDEDQGSITIKTHLFSTYAVLYTDEQEVSGIVEKENCFWHFLILAVTILAMLGIWLLRKKKFMIIVAILAADVVIAIILTVLGSCIWELIMLVVNLVLCAGSFALQLKRK